MNKFLQQGIVMIISSSTVQDVVITIVILLSSVADIMNPETGLHIFARCQLLLCGG